MANEVRTSTVTATSAYDACTAVRAVPGVLLVRSASDNGDGTFAVTYDLVV
jgi:hypothetical protein